MQRLGGSKRREAGHDFDLDRNFPFLVNSIANKISSGGSRVFLRLFGIGVIEWRILYVLADRPGSTAQAICNAIDLDKAAASRSIQVLEKQGYVRTAADPADARRRTLSLTATGASLHDRAQQVALRRQQHLLAGFSDVERETFLDLLRRVHVNAVRMERDDDNLTEIAPAPLTPSSRARRRQSTDQAAA